MSIKRTFIVQSPLSKTDSVSVGTKRPPKVSTIGYVHSLLDGFSWRLQLYQFSLVKYINTYLICDQRTKKVVSYSPGLVDFAIGLVIFVLNLPDGQVLCWGKSQITEGVK